MKAIKNIDVVVSRHPAAIEFIAQELGGRYDHDHITVNEPDRGYRTIPVIGSATVEDVSGKVVAGNLPLHLAAHATAVVAVEFAGAPPRGREYGVPEMQEAGARLTVYGVRHAVDGDTESLPCLTFHEAQQGGYV